MFDRPNSGPKRSGNRLLLLQARTLARIKLRAARRLMVDKITAVPKSEMGQRMGSLDAADIVRLNRSILVFLGLAASFRLPRAGENENRTLTSVAQSAPEKAERP